MKKQISPSLRREIVAFIVSWASKTAIPLKQLSNWAGLPYQKFLRWRKRLAEPPKPKVVPMGSRLLPWEIKAIKDYYESHPGHGYRRLTWMMCDEGVVSTSPSSVYRVLKKAGLLRPVERKESKKGKGFDQPKKPHEHWHTDFSHFEVGGRYYHFISVLDGYSRMILAWQLGERMERKDAELVMQKAKEAYPDANPRVISDRGKQFDGKDFKRFVEDIVEGYHVMTRAYYPQSNGKIERFHRTLKDDAYKQVPLDKEDAERIIGDMIEHYNKERLHSAIGYITPLQCLNEEGDKIRMERKKKLGEAREKRKEYWKKELPKEQRGKKLEECGEAEEARAEERATKEYLHPETERSLGESSSPERNSEGGNLGTGQRCLEDLDAAEGSRNEEQALAN